MTEWLAWISDGLWQMAFHPSGLGLIARKSEMATAPIQDIQEHWALFLEQMEDRQAEVQQAIAERVAQYRSRSERGLLEGGERSVLTMVVIGALEELNDWARDLTGNEVDLGLLIPLGLGAIAVGQLMEQGLRLKEIPWYIPAWYAFDTFIKLNFPEHDGIPSDTSPSPEPP